MIAIIILNYNTPNLTIRCIESIYRHFRCAYKIYLVDNDSYDNSYEVFKRYFKNNDNIEILRADSNYGYSSGNNIGISRAMLSKNDLIMIVNSDVVFLNDVASKLCNVLNTHEDVALCGPIIYNKEMNQTMLIREPLSIINFIKNKKPFCYIDTNYYLKAFLNTENKRKSDIFKTNCAISGCCFMIKADVAREIGMFDDNVFLNFEEDILAIKIRKLGKRNAIELNSKIIHENSMTIKREGAAFERYHRYLSAIYVLRYYTNEPLLLVIFISFINIVPYTVSALLFEDYRRLYKKFVKNWINIIRKKSKIKILT